MTAFLSSMLGRFGIGRLGVNSTLMMFGLGFRACIQALYLLLLTHALGASGYGLFAGSVALAVILAPLSGWGIRQVLLQRVSSDAGCLKTLWAAAIRQILLTGLVLVVALLVLGTLMPVRISLAAMILIGLAELVALPVALAAVSAGLAMERVGMAATVTCLLPLCRLAAVSAGVLVADSPEVTQIAKLHFIGSIIGALCAAAMVLRLIGHQDWRGSSTLASRLRAGTRYAIGAATGTGYQELDKVMMLQLLGAAIIGPYTAAFRVASILTLPVSALISAVLPRMFADHARAEHAGTVRLALLAATAYAALAAIALVMVAPWLPVLLGPGFQTSSHLLLLLAPWPLLFAWHQVLATGLTGQNRQWARVVIEVGGLVLVALLNLWLLPRYGAEGAIIALWASELMMACGCWWHLQRTRR